MGNSKTASFSTTQNKLARLAKAFAHPARVAIVEFLIDQPNCMCGDIVKVLPLSQSTVSQHLKELKSLGIIQGTIAGPSVCYCIDPNQWQELTDTFNIFFNKQPNCSSEDCC